jgi:hypothetical protein
MEVTVARNERTETETFGRMFVDGTYVCDTLEDKDRGLKKIMTLGTLLKLKVKGQTAIPVGRYEVVTNVQSPKLKDKPAYQFINGMVPRITDVPAYDGVLIHIGNTEKDTEGCILVGTKSDAAVLDIVNSTEAFHKLIAILQQRKEGEQIFITVE